MIQLADNEGLDQTAQADLGLRCPHMPEDTFSHAAAHLSNRINEFWQEKYTLRYMSNSSNS